MPAYISWEQYERHLAQLQANRARADTTGVVREGAALLTGLLVCGRCGCRLAVRYREALRGYFYSCDRRQVEYGEARCQEFSGACVDAYVSEQVLRALEPAALELSLAAAQHVERERADLERLWQQRLERATYEAERARRQYDAVEPENRLVARSLERAWEAKLAARQELEEAYQRFTATQSRLLPADEQAAIRALAADMPALWQAPAVTAADRKDIIRQVVQQVAVAVQGESERVHVRVTWVGGLQTEGWVLRPVGRFSQLSYYGALRAAIDAGVAAGLSAAAIADQLNAAGYRPPKRCEEFHAHSVQNLPQCRRHVVAGHSERLRQDEWWLTDLAHEVDMPPVTLYQWLRRGWLTARREEQAPRRWIVWADAAEVARLRTLHQRPIGEEMRRRWAARVVGVAGSSPDLESLHNTPDQYDC